MVLLQHIGHMVVAVKVGWPGFAVTLVFVYVLPLPGPYISQLVESSLLPRKAASLMELGAILKLLKP